MGTPYFRFHQWPLSQNLHTSCAFRGMYLRGCMECSSRQDETPSCRFFASLSFLSSSYPDPNTLHCQTYFFPAFKWTHCLQTSRRNLHRDGPTTLFSTSVIWLFSYVGNSSPCTCYNTPRAEYSLTRVLRFSGNLNNFLLRTVSCFKFI
jgi:hypothetical protein